MFQKVLGAQVKRCVWHNSHYHEAYGLGGEAASQNNPLNTSKIAIVENMKGKSMVQ